MLTMTVLFGKDRASLQNPFQSEVPAGQSLRCPSCVLSTAEQPVASGGGGGEEDEVGARRAQAVQGRTWPPAE